MNSHTSLHPPGPKELRLEWKHDHYRADTDWMPVAITNVLKRDPSLVFGGVFADCPPDTFMAC